MESPRFDDGEKKDNEPLDTVKSLQIGEITMDEKAFQAENAGVISGAGDMDLDAAIQAAVNHRRLNPRQIQLSAIAGSIGATLFVAIGKGVLSGPLALIIAFILWASVIFSVAQCQTEIVTLLPLDGSMIRLAGRIIDPALGVAAGWNYFLTMVSYVMFEATIINTVVTNWNYNESPAILISGKSISCPKVRSVLTLLPVTLLFFLAVNVYRADIFGEAEFWLALGKVLLAIGLMFYTFVTMVGGNPLHDRFGFRYWKDPGVWAGDSSLGRLESFINAVNVAGFCMGGPENISMIAGEARDPRRTVPRAFKTILMRLIIFFIGGGLCVGILVPYNDPALTASSGSYAGTSPYIISMHRLQIPILPSIVTAVLITSIISAGNSFTFNASRSLHALALEGHAPKFLRRLNRKGVPYLAVIVVMLLACLAYLALSSSSAQVLNWILNFSTATTILNWWIMSITWIRFNSAMEAQGLDRKTFLPNVSKYQPYAGWWACGWSFLFIWLQGYAVFLRGKWNVSTFIFNYCSIALAVVIFAGWKVIKRSPFYRSKDVDLHSGLQFFDALTEHYRHVRETAPVRLKDKILAKMFE